MMTLSVYTRGGVVEAARIMIGRNRPRDRGDVMSQVYGGPEMQAYTTQRESLTQPELKNDPRR